MDMEERGSSIQVEEVIIPDFLDTKFGDSLAFEDGWSDEQSMLTEDISNVKHDPAIDIIDTTADDEIGLSSFRLDRRESNAEIAASDSESECEDSNGQYKAVPVRGFRCSKRNEPRSVKAPCSCAKFKCFQKYADATRKRMLENLLKLPKADQNQFLSSHMTKRTTKRPKVLNSRRSFSRSYFLPAPNGRIKVCKEMFMSTFDVTDRMTRLLAEKKQIGRGIRAKSSRSQRGLKTNPETPPSNSNANCDSKSECKNIDAGSPHVNQLPLVNDFDVEEYFEKYRNQTLLFKDDERKLARLARMRAPRSVKPPCSCSRFKCFLKFDDGSRKKLLEDLLKLPIFGQKQFLSSFMTTRKTKQSRVVSSRRLVSRSYFLPTPNGGRIEVCKEMFLATFDCTDKKLRLLAEKQLVERDVSAGDSVSECGEEDFNEGDESSIDLFETLTDDKIAVSSFRFDPLEATAEMALEIDSVSKCENSEVEDHVERVNVNQRQVGHAKSNKNGFAEVDFYSLSRSKEERLKCAESDTHNVPSKKHEINQKKIAQSPVLQYRKQNGRRVSSAPRSVKPPCGCAKLNCSLKFEDGYREELLENLLKLSTAGQNQFLSNHITTRTTRMHTVLNSRRSFSRSYYLPTPSGRVKVCKEMFTSTFDISDRKTRLLAKKQLIHRGIVADDSKTQRNGKINVEGFDESESSSASEPECEDIDNDSQQMREDTDDGGQEVLDGIDDVDQKISEDIDDVGQEVLDNGDDIGQEVLDNGDDENQEVREGIHDSGQEVNDDIYVDYQVLYKNTDDDNFEACDSIDGYLELREDIDDDGQVVETELPLVNDFNIEAYFQKYHTQNPIIDDVKPVKEKKMPRIHQTRLTQYARMRGLEYRQHAGRGISVPSRSVKPPCSCSYFKCFLKFDDATRKKLLANLLKLTTTRQNAFLSNLITTRKSKRSRLLNTRRSSLRSYFLPTPNGRVQVCREMFMSTFDVKGKKIRVLVKRQLMHDEKVKVESFDEGELSYSGCDPLFNKSICSSASADDAELPSAGDSVLDTSRPKSVIANSDSESEFKGFDDDDDGQEVHTKLSLINDFNIQERFDKCQAQAAKENLDSYRSFAQYARMRGLGYRRYAGRGCSVPPRSVKPPCSCSKFKCFLKLDDATRAKLLEGLLKLTICGQNQFLSNHLTIRTTIRSQVPNSKRSFTRSYFLPTPNGRVKVCREMFISTFDITDKKIRQLAKKQLIERSITAVDLKSQNGEKTATEDSDGDDEASYIECDPLLFNKSVYSSASDEHVELPSEGHSSPNWSSIKLEITYCDSESERGNIGDHDSQREEVDNDSQEVNTESPLLANDFNLEEYFEKYQKQTLIINDDEPVKEKKKPKVNPTKLAQYARMRGLEYRQYAGRGTLVPPRSVKPPCSCSLLKCYLNFNDGTRKKLLEKLLKLTTAEQNQFLSNHMTTRKTKRSRVHYSRRSFTRTYFLPTPKGKVQVCREMFAATFDVTDRKLQNLADKQLIERSISAVDSDSQHDEKAAIENCNDDESSYIECDSSNMSWSPKKEIDSESEYENIVGEDQEVYDDSDTDSQQIDTDEIAIVEEFNVEKYFESYQDQTLINDDDKSVNFGENQDSSSLLSWTGAQLEDASNPLTHQRKFIQHARLRGLEHWQTNGVLVPPRSVKPPCGCSRRKCFRKYDDSVRKKMLESLLKLTSSGQKRFLSSHMVIRAAGKGKRSTSSRRLFSRSYFLPAPNGWIEVCKEMFCSTFDIKDKKLRLLAEKQLLDRGISADDLRL
ncbi:uncharacterized protein LOC128742300 [Sabethes cyaneus]|uniref:uncharacterized protein LOC128742300 n=1 Tax=Sabethes cyaneus TaxID=53552 RepID=UPI00237D5F97|nr:uncharacterized protein LOC128742300 [Sabethes cyaneus]